MYLHLTLFRSPGWVRDLESGKVSMKCQAVKLEYPQTEASEGEPRGGVKSPWQPDLTLLVRVRLWESLSPLWPSFS